MGTGGSRLSCVARAAHTGRGGEGSSGGGGIGPATPLPRAAPRPAFPPRERVVAAPPAQALGEGRLNAGAQSGRGNNQRQSHQPGAGPALPAAPTRPSPLLAEAEKGPSSLLRLSRKANPLPTDSDCPATAWLEGVVGGEGGKGKWLRWVSAAHYRQDGASVIADAPALGQASVEGGMVGRRATDSGWMNGQMGEQMER